MRAPMTRDRYQTRVSKFFEYIGIQGKTLEQKATNFAKKGKINSNWALSNILKFVYFQRERAEKKEISGAPFNKYLKKLSTCLGGHALMGPLFSVPLLLVEGDDDYRIWSEIPRHGKLHIAVIPCDGTEIVNYQKTLEKLFASILDDADRPNGYALLDGDKNIPNYSQKYIKFINLSCHESENLYLTNEVVVELGYSSWDSARHKIIQESHRFPDKSADLINVANSNTKTVDCKKVINEIVDILDDKKVLWAQRLGKILGKAGPTGQLADYLGPEIMKELWGG